MRLTTVAFAAVAFLLCGVSPPGASARKLFDSVRGAGPSQSERSGRRRQAPRADGELFCAVGCEAFQASTNPLARPPREALSPGAAAASAGKSASARAGVFFKAKSPSTTEASRTVPLVLAVQLPSPTAAEGFSVASLLGAENAEAFFRLDAQLSPCEELGDDSGRSVCLQGAA